MLNLTVTSEGKTTAELKIALEEVIKKSKKDTHQVVTVMMMEDIILIFRENPPVISVRYWIVFLVFTTMIISGQRATIIGI